MKLLSLSQKSTPLQHTMEQPNVGRKKKDDKAKEKHERNPFSQKHVRLAEALAEKRAAAPKSKRK